MADARSDSGSDLGPLAQQAVYDRAAAEALLHRLLPRVRNLVRYLVRGDGEVDDLTQNAMVAILKGLPTFRGEAPVERWADRIVARSTFAHLRKRRATEAQGRAWAQVLPTQVPPDSYGRRRDLARFLDGLPEEQRDALVLHHVVGLSTPELADWMECSVDTAKSRLRLGMQKLRDRYGAEAPS